MEEGGGGGGGSAEEAGGGLLFASVAVGGDSYDDLATSSTAWPYDNTTPTDTMSLDFIIPYDSTWAPAVLQRIITLVITMVITLLGNGVILATLTCSRYRVRTGRTSSRVNIFILNLAVADITVCGITMSGELVFAVCGEWVLGEAACKLLVYGEIVALGSTVFILLAMTYDRFLAICHPLRFKNSVSRARRTILLAWVLALLLAVPQLFIFVQIQEGVRPDGRPVYSCKSRGYSAEWQRRVYLACLTVCILLLPTAIITFCYVSIVRVVWRQGQQQTVVASNSTISLRKTGANDKQLSRAKVRTVKLTLCIIVAFVACWTPYFVVHNLRVHSHYEIKIAEPILVFAETIALFNSALNPIVYGCFNLRVKKALHESCCSRRRRGEMPAGGGHGHLASYGGSTQSHARVHATHVSDECSSSCVEETVIVNAASTSTSPSGSAKLRVNHSSSVSSTGRGAVNNGVHSCSPGACEARLLEQQQMLPGTDACVGGGCGGGNKRPGSRRNREMYEMKRRSNPSRREART